MAKEKNIRLVIPADLNSKLNYHLLKIRDLGVDITKAELIVRLADLGLKIENQEIKIDSIKP